MSSDFDRDDQIDRLLKGARREAAEAAAVTESCLDAEMLAAWADSALEPAQKQLVESHVATCARCQALIAAFVSTDETPVAIPRTPAKVLTLRRLSPKVWLPIAGTVAASVLIWIGVREQFAPAPIIPESQISKSEGAPATIPITPGAGRLENAPAPKPAPPAESREARQRLDAIEAVEVGRGTKSARKDAAAAPATKPVAAEPLPVAAAPPPPPPPPPVIAPTLTPTPIGTTGAQSNAARDAVAFRTMAPVVVAEFSVNVSLQERALGPAVGFAGGGARRGGGGRGAAVGQTRAIQEAPQAPPPAHWRILAGDVLQKSVDKATWEAVILDPPVQGLLNGSAPAPLICWIVGKNGLVLLSTDARQFTRLTSPAAVDVTSITAIDARQATVTTADGRKFATTDGGKTWRLQDF